MQELFFFLDFLDFSSSDILSPAALILSAPGRGSEPVGDLCRDLEGILCHTHSQTQTVKTRTV